MVKLNLKIKLPKLAVEELKRQRETRINGLVVNKMSIEKAEEIVGPYDENRIIFNTLASAIQSYIAIKWKDKMPLDERTKASKLLTEVYDGLMDQDGIVEINDEKYNLLIDVLRSDLPNDLLYTVLLEDIEIQKVNKTLREVRK